MSETLLRSTSSLCRVCKTIVPAEVWRVGGRVMLRKRCDAHGVQEALVSSSASWYDEVMARPPVLERPPVVKKEVELGCPRDCGPCTQHEQRIHMPVVPITSACNLDCPICYTHNRNDGPFHMSEEELGAILEHLRRAAPEKRIINITGGEPTQHPRFERLIERCHEEGIRRITISTHGLRFLKDERLLERLARLEARIILSFDSFEVETNRQMLGGNFRDAKLKVLDLLEKHGVDTTLLPVLARGYNDHEVGAIVDLALSRDFIRSVEFHTMTFTGQYGVSFDREARYTTYDVLVDLERQTGGRLRVSDFVPAPAAHPLCYLVTYLMRLDDGRWVPYPRFMAREDLRELLAGTLYMEPGMRVEARLQDVINRLWAGDIVCDDVDEVLRTLKATTKRMFASGSSRAGDPEEARIRVSEQVSKAIYVHSHMDEETFDTDRIRQCCVGMPGPDGSNIPSCAYNVLYRERDPRFHTETEGYGV